MYNVDHIKITFKDRISVYRALKKGNTNIFAPSLLDDFEQKFTEKLNTKYTCVFPNCTSAIFTAINALKLKDNDEIIVPNLTHSSSLYPLVLNNIKFKTYEFEKNSYNADITHLESLITKNTKVIMICYLHGYPINTNEIKKICKKYKIALIEDSAQGFGIKINNKYAGTIGDFGCFSFGESKLLRVGEGGAIIANNRKYINEINKIRHVGEIWKCNGENTVKTMPTYYDLVSSGLDYDGRAFNLRVMPFTFAYASNKLKKIDNIIKSRQLKLKKYYDILKNVKGLEFISNIEYGIQNTAPFSAWIILDEKINIIKIISACISSGIPIGKFKYDVVSNMKYFKDSCLNEKNDYKNSTNIKDRSLFLPIYENLSIKDIEKIAKEFINILNLYDTNPEDQKFNTDILKNDIRYFNGFFIK